MYNKRIIEMPSKWDSIIPDDTFENLVICISGAPIKKNFSVLLTNTIQDLNFMEHSICFPMYMYDREEKHRDAQMTLFGDMAEEDTVTYKKRFAIRLFNKLTSAGISCELYEHGRLSSIEFFNNLAKMYSEIEAEIDTLIDNEESDESLMTHSLSVPLRFKSALWRAPQ